jgi:hypothetical protein
MIPHRHVIPLRRHRHINPHIMIPHRYVNIIVLVSIMVLVIIIFVNVVKCHVIKLIKLFI